jgi:hypothetical protein
MAGAVVSVSVEVIASVVKAGNINDFCFESMAFALKMEAELHVIVTRYTVYHHRSDNAGSGTV